MNINLTQEGFKGKKHFMVTVSTKICQLTLNLRIFDMKQFISLFLNKIPNNDSLMSNICQQRNFKCIKLKTKH